MNEPKRIIVCKFDSTVEDEESNGVIVEITKDIPMAFLSNGPAQDFYDHQAGELAYALFSSLPQGTLDRLIIKLMEHKVSLYRGKTKS